MYFWGKFFPEVCVFLCSHPWVREFPAYILLLFIKPCSAIPASSFPSAALSSNPLSTEVFWLCLTAFQDVHDFPSKRIFQMGGNYEDFFSDWHRPKCSWWQQTHTFLTCWWKRLWQSLVRKQSPNATTASFVKCRHITAPDALHQHLLVHHSWAWINPTPCGIQVSEPFCCRWIHGH